MITDAQRSLMPDDKDVEKLLALDVNDSTGKAVSFKTLVNDPGHPRVLTIWVRHFFCGFCEAYVRALAKDLPPDVLAKLDPPTKIIIIGCGDPALISSYAERTNCSFEVYADHTRATYDALSFVTTLNGGDQNPSYAEKSFIWTAWSSFLNNLGAGSKMLSGGKASQNGGELIWVNGKLDFISRMRNTTDHLSVADLSEKLGVSLS